MRLVFDRDAEQSADHRDWQGMGQVGDEVKLTVGRRLVKKRVDHAGDVGFQRLDDLGHEGFADQPAQPGVIGRVEKQEARALLLRLGPVCDLALHDRRLRPVVG